MVLKARRIAGAALASLALLGGTVAAPAGAHQAVVRAHIAVGCASSSGRHHRHHSRQAGTRCQSVMRGHLFFAHAA